MTLTLDLATVFWSLVSLGGLTFGAYVAIRADLASHAARISEAMNEAIEAKAACSRAHVRIDDHVSQWHRQGQ